MQHESNGKAVQILRWLCRLAQRLSLNAYGSIKSEAALSYPASWLDAF